MPKNTVDEVYKVFRQKFIQAYKNPEIQILDKVFEAASTAHAPQTRASGDPYILHPLAVAEILLNLKLDQNSIFTAILHDTIEDTYLTYEAIEKIAGTEVANLVDGVTKLTRIEYQPEHIKQAENFRKLLLAISEDIRVLLVKLADRLHNMRTLHHIQSVDKRLRIAHETIEIYSPLAERIGIYKFKNELQDLAFAFLHPEVKKSIISRLAFLRKQGKSLVETIEKEITATMQEAKIHSDVKGREKTACSIWKKMERKNVPFEQLSDIMAFRIIVDNIADCYHALGIIHSKYHMIPGEFKDYISTPKVNGYQSLHTVVMGPEKRCIEIQIRTHEMHEVAELGVAAHWSYKQNVTSHHKQGKQFRWIRELLNILENTSSPEEFLENTKLEMYYDQVFCFTPKGELIALPRAATPVDFAFAVHTNIGLRCIGAKVNSRIVPLKTQLENGDQVEILCAKHPMPSPTWEKFVVTGKAKACLRKYIRNQQREEYFNLGKALLNKAFKAHQKKFHESVLESLKEKLQQETTQDIVVLIGEGLLDTKEIIKLVYPEDTTTDKKKKNPLAFLTRFRKKKKDSGQNSLPIKGLIPGMAVHFAGCCHPLPGDQIVGIVSTGKGVAIHTVECDSLESFASQPEKWLDISWEGASNELYTGRIKAVVLNDKGTLAAIGNATLTMQANISNFKIVHRSIDFYETIIDVEVKGIGQLNNIIAALRSLDCVHTAERVKS